MNFIHYRSHFGSSWCCFCFVCFVALQKPHIWMANTEPRYVRTRLGVQKLVSPGIEMVSPPEIKMTDTWNPDTFLYLLYTVANPAWHGLPAEKQYPVLIVPRGTIGASDFKLAHGKKRLVNKPLKAMAHADM